MSNVRLQMHSEQELQQLTKKAAQLWEFDYAKHLISRKRRPWFKWWWQWVARPLYRVPCQALYRLAKERWRGNSTAIKITFPFEGQGVAGVYKLAEGWAILSGDLKFLENGPLYAADGRTVIVPAALRWHETGWGWMIRWIVVPIVGYVLSRLAGIAIFGSM